MKHFTIDTDNNITVHASKKAARDMGAPVFANEVQLADLIGPDNKRLVEIWNSLPGVKPVTKFANRKLATERIWKTIQSLGEASAAAPGSEQPVGAMEVETAVAAVPVDAPSPELAEAEQPLENAALQTPVESAGADLVDQPAEAAEPVATVSADVPDVAPTAAEPGNETTPAKKAPKAKKGAKAEKPAKTESGPREGSKTAQVVAMLQRKDGATLAEIMDQMGWQKHTVRGFMAGAMKKAGHTVESFKSEKGERLPDQSIAWPPPSSPARLRPRRAFLLVFGIPAPDTALTVAHHTQPGRVSSARRPEHSAPSLAGAQGGESRLWSDPRGSSGGLHLSSRGIHRALALPPRAGGLVPALRTDAAYARLPPGSQCPSVLPTCKGA